MNATDATRRAAELGAEHGRRDAEAWLSVDAGRNGPHDWCLICDGLLLLTDWQDGPIWAHREAGCDDPEPTEYPHPDFPAIETGWQDGEYVSRMGLRDVRNAYDDAYRAAVAEAIRARVTP